MSGTINQQGFNVENFKSRINGQGGLARTSTFLVVITPPPCLRNSIIPGGSVQTEVGGNITTSQIPSTVRPNEEVNQLSDNLVFLCSAAAVPGVQVQVADVQPYGYGAIERRPTSAFFNSMRMNYYVDVNSAVYQFFTRWLSCIVNFNDNAVGTRTVNSGFFNEVQYKDDYVTTVNIYVYEPTGKNFLEIQLKEAFPIEIGQVNLTWGNYNSLAILPINLSYSNWVSNYTPVAQVSAAGLRNLTVESIEGGLSTSLGLAASSILRRPQGVTDIRSVIDNAITRTSRVFR